MSNSVPAQSSDGNESVCLCQIGSYEAPEQSPVIGNLQMYELVNDDLPAEGRRLAQEVGAEGQPPRRGAARPLTLHWPNVDFLWLHSYSLCPCPHLSPKDLVRNNIFQGCPRSAHTLCTFSHDVFSMNKIGRAHV